MFKIGFKMEWYSIFFLFLKWLNFVRYWTFLEYVTGNASKEEKKKFEIAVVLALQMKIASIGLSCLLVHTSKTAPMLCFFSLQEKLVSQSRRQLAGIFSVYATCVLGSADYYQCQHLALLACFKQSSIFLCFQKQEIPCAFQWNSGLNISKSNCWVYKTSWSDGLFYSFLLTRILSVWVAMKFPRSLVLLWGWSCILTFP